MFRDNQTSVLVSTLEIVQSGLQVSGCGFSCRVRAEVLDDPVKTGDDLVPEGLHQLRLGGPSEELDGLTQHLEGLGTELYVLWYLEEGGDDGGQLGEH